MKFTTDAGKEYMVRLNYAAPSLLEAGGKAKVDEAAAAMTAQQPFAINLESYNGADVVERTVTEVLV
jgi:hypothetical protein